MTTTDPVKRVQSVSLVPPKEPHLRSPETVNSIAARPLPLFSAESSEGHILFKKKKKSPENLKDPLPFISLYGIFGERERRLQQQTLTSIQRNT